MPDNSFKMEKLLTLILFAVWIISSASAQRGVCYSSTAHPYTRSFSTKGSRQHNYYVACGWWGWNWARCHRSSTEYYYYPSYTTDFYYSQNRFCCPGYTKVRGRCTLPIQLTPSYGHMFGGTPIVVTGPTYSPSDRITCLFGGIPIEAVYINDGQAMCVSPRFQKIGEIDFIVYVVANNGDSSRFDSTFISLSPDRAHVVDISSPSLLLQPISAATITWTPEDIAPRNLPSTTNPINVDVTLYMQEYSQNERSWNVKWKVATPLALNVPNNNGRIEVLLPPLALNCRLPLHDNVQSVEVGLCPVIVRVSVSEERRQGFSLPDTVGIWSGVVYMESSFPKPNLRAVCDNWGDYEMRSGVSGDSLLDQVAPCPPTSATARNDRTYEEEQLTSLFRATSYSQKAMVFFHSGVTTCYRQFAPNSEGFGQQCCYKPDGNLLRGEPSGGSVDMMSPKVDYNRHIADDIMPYILCCKGGNGQSNCNEYFQWRPSGDQIGYSLPVPACIFGDPHIITLDGLKYTFNGKGEFTMIETMDRSFILQGRMDTILDTGGNPTPGTVFTALVAREERTNTTVQFDILSNKVRIHVNHRIVDLTSVSELIKENVTVTDNGKNSASAVFKEGTKMEIRVENGIISVMLITLPDSLKGRTRGLMGNFNGDKNDDLIPKNLVNAISPNSSLQDIHNQFGITWILHSASESLFTYNSGESFATFYNPSFNPAFEPSFKNSVLEEQAREVCGDDENCLFDVAATSNIDIGRATLGGLEGFDEIVEMSIPIVCEPPCMNGACVQNDTCSCSEGFEGERCETPVTSPCDVNMCQNSGICERHVQTYTCNCRDGYSGAFCEKQEPPFHIRLINGSPRVSNGTVLIDFEPSSPLSSAECHLRLPRSRKRNCIGGRIQYSNVPAGSYVFVIQAASVDQELAAVRRTIHIGEIGDEDFCAIHLINEGIVVDGQSVSIFFQGTSAVDSYQCKLSLLIGEEDDEFISCRSPTRYQNMDVGEYRFQVLPVGCEQGKRLSVKFSIV